MRFKIAILFLMFTNCFLISSMENTSENISENHSAKIADEIALHIIEFAVKGNNIRETLKNLARLKSVDKRFERLCSDVTFVKTLLIFHLYDEDYQTVLNQMLFQACRMGNKNLMEILAAVPNTPKSKAREICDENNNEEVEVTEEEKISFLDANINSADSLGNFPLTYAVDTKNIEFIDLLLKLGAIVCIKNGNNDTALIYSVRRGYKDATEHLLNNVGEEDGIDTRGFGKETAFICAAKKCIYATDQNTEDNYLEILNLLANKGADVNASDAADLSVMDWAVKENKMELIIVLLNFNAHLSPKNKAELKICLPRMTQNEDVEELLEMISKLEEKDVKIEVNFDLKNEPYWLSFKIGNEMYKAENENEDLNREFARKIGELNDSTCIKIGEAIVETVFNTGAAPNSIVQNTRDQNDYKIAFETIFSEIFSEASYAAENIQNNIAINKIREMLKPVFRAFPDKSYFVYVRFLKIYKINE